MTNSKIIVVSGVTAGGKTTLIQALADSVNDSYTISFDDYSIDALPSAPSFDFFLENSKKAINQYDISELMADLLNVINHYKFIFIDFPFGYEHNILKPFIDIVIYLQTPLDISFARQILRDYSERKKEDIIEWADTYLNYARPIFVEHDKVVSSTADIILDGQIELEKQIEYLKTMDVF